MKPRTQIILVRTAAVIASVGIAIAGLFGLFWFASLLSPPDETTEVAAYVDTLEQWSRTGLVAHFPSEVPPQAEDVKFAAFPGWAAGRRIHPASNAIACE